MHRGIFRWTTGEKNPLLLLKPATVSFVCYSNKAPAATLNFSLPA